MNEIKKMENLFIIDVKARKKDQHPYKLIMDKKKNNGREREKKIFVFKMWINGRLKLNLARGTNSEI